MNDLGFQDAFVRQRGIQYENDLALLRSTDHVFVGDEDPGWVNAEYGATAAARNIHEGGCCLAAFTDLDLGRLIRGGAVGKAQSERSLLVNPEPAIGQ